MSSFALLYYCTVIHCFRWSFTKMHKNMNHTCVLTCDAVKIKCWTVECSAWVSQLYKQNVFTCISRGKKRVTKRGRNSVTDVGMVHSSLWSPSLMEWHQTFLSETIMKQHNASVLFFLKYFQCLPEHQCFMWPRLVDRPRSLLEC